MHTTCVSVTDPILLSFRFAFFSQPIQHREVQYSESALFHSCFGSVTYLDGGIDSGYVFKTSCRFRSPGFFGLLLTSLRSTSLFRSVC